MLICPLRIKPDLPALLVNNRPLDIVSVHKVFGITLCNTLTWNDHVNVIFTKAAKRLYILRLLKRAGIPPKDLVNVYFALGRSVLEYCCVTWATNIPAYINDKIERVQKRALRVLFPEKHYSDALSCANVTRLDVRREEPCLKVWHNIQAVPYSR